MRVQKTFILPQLLHQISDEIGADWLVYQELEDLVDAVSHYSSSIKQFDTSCFSGEYITGDVSVDYLQSLEAERSDEAKIERQKLTVVK